MAQISTMALKSLRTSPATARILKALSIFGSMQIFTIFCSLVRNKFVALWIGPAGIGIITLYNQALEILSHATQLNLRQSAVRDLAQHRHGPGAFRLIAAVRRVALALGLAGMCITIVLSPLLSRWTFGDANHTLGFALLSLLLLTTSVAAGDMAIMQGRDQLKEIARANIAASISAVFVAAPLIWFLRLKGIVPMLVAYGVANWLFARMYSRTAESTRIPLREAFSMCTPLLKLGIYLTASAAVSIVASYLFSVFLRYHYGDATVGLYQAGYTLVNNYVGLVFTAISMEYYPRLSSVAKQNKRVSVIAAHEMRVAMFILMPVATTFLCCRELIVHILYSTEFDAIIPYISVGIAGAYLRAFSWCLAFVILAKGDGRMYILSETISSVAYLAINVFIFPRWGFDGMGYAYVAWFAVYCAVTYAICHYRFGLRLPIGLWLLTAATLMLTAAEYVSVRAIGPWITLAIALPITAYAAFRAIRR